jgi:transcriptional regulator with XRE-family HTH domain
MGSRFRDLRLRLRPELARHQDFADALHVTAQTVRNWEHGRPIPDRMKRAICKLLGCDLTDFFIDWKPLEPPRLRWSATWQKKTDVLKNCPPDGDDEAT